MRRSVRWMIAAALTAPLCGTALATRSLATTIRELWITGQGTNSIYIREFPTAKPLGQLALPQGAQPHLMTFHSGAFAYVGGMGDGKLYIIDAAQRQVAQALSVASALVHQAKVSPDGTTALVAVVGEKKVVKMDVNEAGRSWRVAASASLITQGKAPICTVFRADSKRAYVSLFPSGIAVIDVPTMEVLRILETDGFIACGMIKAADGQRTVIASAGSGGHMYTLDMSNDSLADRGTLGTGSWHSFNMVPSGSLGFGTSPMTDEVIVIDLTTQPVTRKATIRLDARPGAAANQPDALGGGDPISGDVLPVSLRAAGQLALVDVVQLKVKAFVPIAPPHTFDPNTCNGCAIHGVALRP